MSWFLAGPQGVALPIASHLPVGEIAAAQRRVALRRALRRRMTVLGLPASLLDGLRTQPMDALRATARLLVGGAVRA